MKKDELFELVVVLTAKNMALEEQIKSYDQTLLDIEQLNACNNDCDCEDDYDEELEKAREIESRMLLDEDEDEDDSDFTPPSYEDVVDPECDRGFKLGQDWLIDDIMKYLQGLKDSK
jgi:hypothetical protein